MTIHLDSEIVATGFDPVTQACSYTIERDGKRWTVVIPKEHFDKHGANKVAKRTHLANTLNNAMQGPHDEPVVLEKAEDDAPQLAGDRSDDPA